MKSNIKRVLLWYFLKKLFQVHVHGSGEIKEIPRVVSYYYSSIEFADNESWDSHVQKVIHNGKKNLIDFTDLWNISGSKERKETLVRGSSTAGKADFGNCIVMTAILEALDWLNGQLSSVNATQFPWGPLHGIPCTWVLLIWINTRKKGLYGDQDS